MSCHSGDSFICTGPLVLTQSEASQEGKFYLTCSSTEENYDCACSPLQDFNVTTCDHGQTDTNICSYLTTSPANPCTITWKGDYTGYVDGLPKSCSRALLSPSCKTRCQWTTTGTLQCKSTIICSASPGPVRTTSGNVCTHVSSDVITTTSPTTTSPTTSPPTTDTTKDAGPGSTILALGVVAGLAVIALVITLAVLYFVLRRHRKRHTPTNKGYTDIDVREVDNTTYESSVGIPNQCEHLGNECSNGKDSKLGLYLDLDDTTILQSSQSPGQDGTADSIYNSIDEYEPNGDQGYAQTNDLPAQSAEVLACPIAILQSGSLQERATRDTTVEENSEDYDHLFQKPNKNAVYDADNDYDHMNNDDILTSL